MKTRFPKLRFHQAQEHYIRTRNVWWLVLLVCVFTGTMQPGYSGEIVLKNGLRLPGVPFKCQGMNPQVVRDSNTVASYPIWGLDDGYRRYFVPKIQLAPDGLNQDVDLSKSETFDIEQPRKSRRSTPSVVGGMKVTPFDKYGRRTVTLSFGSGTKDFVEGITKITPTYLQVEALSYDWVHGVAITSLPIDTLHAIIMQSIDENDPLDRHAVCQFYIEAQMYKKASTELKSLIADHPDYAAKNLKPVEADLLQMQARILLQELKRRKAAGQHELTMVGAKKFPIDKLGAEAGRSVRELLDEYDKKAELLDLIDTRLSDFQSQIDDEDLMAEIADVRMQMSRELDYGNLDRLAPFVNLSNDETLSAKEKLSFAFSGWMLGEANAVSDLKQTLNLWKARFLILEIVRADLETDRTELVAELTDLEGISHERIRQLIPNLPPLIETPGVAPGQQVTLEVPGRDGLAASRYTVVLPPEYSPNHTYPMIVTLRPQNRTIERQLSFWAGTNQSPGQAQRHGYIVIAPHYIDDDHPRYEHDARSHQVVLDSIVDARKRFQVDSDRIFLTGHGMGGDAAIDLGMSHPDYFAGVLPFTGFIGEICKWYWKNAELTGWYFVAGELDRHSLDHNARVLNRMMRARFDIVYVEYKGRGYEAYYEEIHRVFEWMSFQKRTSWPKEIDMVVKRPLDNSFYWMKGYGLPRNLQQPSTRPMMMNIKVSAGNTMRLKSGGASHDLFLSPDIVDFDKKLTVLKGSKKKFNDKLKPSILHTLESLRETGDRQKLCWQRIRITDARSR